ncbi:hypothetical protein BJF78_20090 [Pseudonocardia sp. CNS-139]|nr:hypothetical protein BJF78_20090 [Pseudonocardia sp. CNS-139]
MVPAFEIISTVADAHPGPDGDYSAEAGVAELRPWVEAARTAGVYVVLDLQPGRTDFLTQARRYATCSRSRTSGSRSTPSGGCAPTRCTWPRSVRSVSTRSTAWPPGSPT